MFVTINSTTSMGSTPTDSGLASFFFSDSAMRQLPGLNYADGTDLPNIEAFFRDLQAAGILTESGASIDWASYLAIPPVAPVTCFPITDFFFVVTGLKPSSPFSIIPMSVSRLLGSLTVWGFDPGINGCLPWEAIKPTNWALSALNPYATAYSNTKFGVGNFGPVYDDSFLSINGDIVNRPLVQQRLSVDNVGPGSTWSFVINRPFADQTYPIQFVGSGVNPIIANNDIPGWSFSDNQAISQRGYEMEILLDNFNEGQGVFLYIVIPRGRVIAATGANADAQLYRNGTNVIGQANGPANSIAPNNIEIVRIDTAAVPSSGVVANFASVQPYAPADGGDINTGEYVRVTTSAAPWVNTAFPS